MNNSNQTIGTKIPEPQIGDKVLYVMEGGRAEGKIRPAFIVEIFNNSGLPADNSPPAPMVNLQVLTDGTNDGFDSNFGGLAWKTSRHFNADKMPGTWHYPAAIDQQQKALTTSQGTELTPELELTAVPASSSAGIF
jgi:hypothetical protein